MIVTNYYFSNNTFLLGLTLNSEWTNLDLFEKSDKRVRVIRIRGYFIIANVLGSTLL